MNIDHLNDINIFDYDLPNEITNGWCDMIEFIEEYNEIRTNKIKSYYDLFLIDMHSRGFTRNQVEGEIRAYYAEKSVQNKFK